MGGRENPEPFRNSVCSLWGNAGSDHSKNNEVSRESTTTGLGRRVSVFLFLKVKILRAKTDKKKGRHKTAHYKLSIYHSMGLLDSKKPTVDCQNLLSSKKG